MGWQYTDGWTDGCVTGLEIDNFKHLLISVVLFWFCYRFRLGTSIQVVSHFGLVFAKKVFVGSRLLACLA